MVRNHFTHQEIHEISSKGISGAEILFILVERVLIGLADHDGAIQCWFAILKKRVFSVIFILSQVMWMIIVCIMHPSLKLYLLLLYKCECTAEAGCYKVYVEVRGQICGVNSPLFIIMCLLRTDLGSPGLWGKCLYPLSWFPVTVSYAQWLHLPKSLKKYFLGKKP